MRQQLNRFIGNFIGKGPGQVSRHRRKSNLLYDSESCRYFFYKYIFPDRRQHQIFGHVPSKRNGTELGPSGEPPSEMLESLCKMRWTNASSILVLLGDGTDPFFLSFKCFAYPGRASVYPHQPNHLCQEWVNCMTSATGVNCAEWVGALLISVSIYSPAGLWPSY